MDTAAFLSERGYLTISSMVLYLSQHHPTKSVSYPTLKRYIAKGYLHYVKVGGQYRLTKESIDRYVEHGTDQPSTRTEGEGAQMLPTPLDQPLPPLHIPIVENKA